MLGDRLFMTTIDAHLLALDMKTGAVVYDVKLEDYKVGYSATVAPLVVKDKVIIGIAGAEYGIRGFIEAFDAQTGKKLWRFYTVAGPDEFGGNTWPKTDAYLRGGGSIWVTGTYDPEQNLVFFGTGNPGPDYYSANREGDNLFTASIVALDADTGKLKWHYQFTPHDVHDWDATQVPVLGELTIDGQPRKVVMFANRNGFFYTIDRVTGKLIVAKPFVETTWAKEISSVTGRPILLPDNHPNEQGARTCPDLGGGTNFMSPSYDPALQLFFVTARETCATYFAFDQEFKVGVQYMAGGTVRPRDQRNWGALRAIDPVTAERKWEFRYPTTSASGVLSTASGLVFAGDGDGNILAFESRTGKNLWHYQLGAPLRSTSGTTYMLDGRQYLLVPAGSMLTAFALPERRRRAGRVSRHPRHNDSASEFRAGQRSTGVDRLSLEPRTRRRTVPPIEGLKHRLGESRRSSTRCRPRCRRGRAGRAPRRRPTPAAARAADESRRRGSAAASPRLRRCRRSCRRSGTAGADPRGWAASTSRAAPDSSPRPARRLRGGPRN